MAAVSLSAREGGHGIGLTVVRQLIAAGHTVLWDALDETAEAVGRFLAGGQPS